MVWSWLMVNTSFSGVAVAKHIPLYSVTGIRPAFMMCKITSVLLHSELSECVIQTWARMDVPCNCNYWNSKTGGFLVAAVGNCGTHLVIAVYLGGCAIVDSGMEMDTVDFTETICSINFTAIGNNVRYIKADHLMYIHIV